MKTRLKQLLVMGLMVMGLGMGKAWAWNPDTMVVSVTPSVTYSVSISSPMNQGYQFGTVALGATTISTVAIAVSNNGTVAESFSLAITNSAPGNWAPAGSSGADQFRMSGYFNTTQPADGTFGAADDLTTSVPGTAANKFGQGVTKTNASSSKNLWLRLVMPTSITGAAVQQTMTLTVNGQGS